MTTINRFAQDVWQRFYRDNLTDSVGNLITRAADVTRMIDAHSAGSLDSFTVQDAQPMLSRAEAAFLKRTGKLTADETPRPSSVIISRRDAAVQRMTQGNAASMPQVASPVLSRAEAALLKRTGGKA